ncbi:MAG TPA: pitrilysin family protein [Longimicrobium sp.]|nr:pitrilysin family protein [Longimicrobium sp.]
MTPRVVRGGLAALALLAAVPLGAQAPGARTPAFETYRLQNGLRVILAPDAAAPTVAVNVWYDVGSRDEKQGRTGFAHLFEHMMFQGSANVEKGAHMSLVSRAGGGNLNGSTSADRTNYYQTLPSNRLNLGLWLEADRMRALAVNQENFANQREVVKEEKRLRVDNAPYAAAVRGMLSDVGFNPQGCFAYGHTAIGSMEDLNAATLDDVRAFHSMYYRPGNATITLVGGFEPARARELITEYFGTIPAGPAPQRTTCEQPFSHFPVRRVFPDANAQLPALWVAYGIPGPTHADMPAVRVLNTILADGKSSRLSERLVNRERAAAQLVPIFMEQRGPSLAMYGMIANQGTDAARLESLFDEEVARVRTGGVTEAELAKARNRLRAAAVLERQTPAGLAEAFQYYAHFHGDPAAIRQGLAAEMRVTADDVKRVANQYFSPSNRAVGITQPARAGQE